jgi:CubicO group peptidase (beta-lactamase class C family)
LTQDRFYKPLGANNTTYLPLKKFPKDKIVPTENDQIWRHQLLQGDVHDQGAALLGGIGGQAGLFSNANDVAKIMQMYLNGGEYGGKQYLEQETIDKFNTCYFCESNVRRGVGFDKPQLDEYGPTCGCVSMTSFGHSGFTGTLTWADPAEEIVYVFLSNRVHPSAENKKLIRSGIRTKIQKLIYEAIDQ